MSSITTKTDLSRPLLPIQQDCFSGVSLLRDLPNNICIFLSAQDDFLRDLFLNIHTGRKMKHTKSHRKGVHYICEVEKISVYRSAFNFGIKMVSHVGKTTVGNMFA